MSKTEKQAKPVKSSGWFINLCAFVAVVLIGLSLILSKIGALGEVANAFMVIANVIAYIVVSVVSVFYVARKKNIWLWIIWIVAIVLIVVSYIL